jgi:hypothetical protein
MGAVDLQRAQAAQDRLVETLGEHTEVNGVGIARADGGYVLKVNVRTDRGRYAIPPEVDGVTVQVHTVGRIRKRQAA